MHALHSIHRLLSAVVYAVTITLGTGIFVIHPARVLLAVPALAGVVLAGHAAATAHLEELGAATVWLWVTVLVLAVGGLAVERLVYSRSLPPAVELPVVRAVGTLGLLGFLVARYRRALRRERQGDWESPPARQ